MKEELNLMIEMLSDTIGTRAVDALGFLLAFALTALMDSMFRPHLCALHRAGDAGCHPVPGGVPDLYRPPHRLHALGLF